MSARALILSLFTPIAADAAAAPLVRVLEPRTGWRRGDLARLWQYRELLAILALRDVKIRYKQTLLGALWAVIQPLGLMVIMTTIRRIFGIGGANDPVVVYAALLPWIFFAGSVTSSTNSLVANANMLRKVYFPRLIVPLAAVGAPLLDYALGFVVLLGIMVWFQVALSWQLMLLPVLVLSTIVAALGVGVLLSALTVAYRDFRYVVTFLMQIWFFLSPVFYTVSELPLKYRGLMCLNPMGGTIEAFRSAVLGTPIDWAAWAVSTGVALVFLLIGLIYFGRAERRFADIV